MRSTTGFPRVDRRGTCLPWNAQREQRNADTPNRKSRISDVEHRKPRPDIDKVNDSPSIPTTRSKKAIDLVSERPSTNQSKHDRPFQIVRNRRPLSRPPQHLHNNNENYDYNTRNKPRGRLVASAQTESTPCIESLDERDKAIWPEPLVGRYGLDDPVFCRLISAND
jgi:hypothetical protein